MFTAAIPSVVCGMLTWIVVESEPANTIGVCQTETDAVFAARAAFAKTSVATAAAATSALRKCPVMRAFLSF
jgi:predicted aspartyl protease